MHQNMYGEEQQQSFYFQQELSYSNFTSGESSVHLFDLSQSIQNLSEQFKLMLDSQKQALKKQQEYYRIMEEEFASTRRFVLHKLRNSSKSTCQGNQMKRRGHSSCINMNLLNIQASFSENSSQKLPKPNNQMSHIVTTISRVSSLSIVEEDSLFKTNQVVFPVQPQQQVIECHLGHPLSCATLNSVNTEVKCARVSTFFFESAENLLHHEVNQFQETFKSFSTDELQSMIEYLIVVIQMEFQQVLQKWYQRYSTFHAFTNFDGFKTRRRKECIEVFRNAFH
jgi:hypothetical protein